MTKAERAAKWEASFIPCNKHPEKRCLRSQYIHNRHKICSICHNATFKAAQLRYTKSERRAATQSRYNHSEKGLQRDAWRKERVLHG